MPEGTSSPKKLADKATYYILYLVAFLFAYHIALTLYVNSSYLAQFLPEASVGVIYAGASLTVILLLALYPRFLRVFGNYRSILTLVSLEAMLLIALAVAPNALIAIPAFIASQIAISLVLFNLDIFLETLSVRRLTGSLRAGMLTAINIAIMLGPLTAGTILTDSQFSRVYLVSAILLVPAWILIARRFVDFRDPAYKRTPFFRSVMHVLRDPDLRHVLIANLTLRFFYAWMVIYTPLYLSQHIGFSWSEIGVILTIMLIPFIVLEWPVGRLADTRLGEKEFMLAGFLIMAVFAASLSFLTIPSLVLWTVLLLGTRIGASFVEITSESYFFKHINGKDTDILSVFRDNRPLAYIIAPSIASLLLIFLPLQYLFAALAGIVALGGLYTIGIRDTK